MDRLADLVWVWRRLAKEVVRDEGMRIVYRRCADELARALEAIPAREVRDWMRQREWVVLQTLLASLDRTVRRILAAPSAGQAHAQLERLSRSVRDLVSAFDALETADRDELDAVWTDLGSVGGVEVEPTRALPTHPRRP